LASTTLLNTNASQLTATLAAPGGHTASVTNLSLEAQPGAARLATLALSIDGIGGYTIQFLMTDQGFEDYDIWGGQKGQGVLSSQSGSAL
jgi:hypothetical protein